MTIDDEGERMSELDEESKAKLKDMIRRLHAGESPAALKDEFREVLDDVGPEQISRLEEELIAEGMPREEMRRLCDVHLMVFRETLESGGRLAPPWHPIGVLTDEHEAFLGFMSEMRSIVDGLGPAADTDATGAMGMLLDLRRRLADGENHYVREENVLFPYLERHGVTEPPKIMWMDHDQIRAAKKGLFEVIDGLGERPGPDMVGALRRKVEGLADLMEAHFYKENNILFPTALSLISPDEWAAIRREFDDLGYSCVVPGPMEGTGTAPATPAEAGAGGESPDAKGDMIPLDTGPLTLRELESIMNTLPVDISFVDRDDIVRYFNDAPDRIFPRTRAVIGRTVQNCHPQKSLHLVERILREMERGERDEAEFWIQMGGRFVHIRYLAVRDRSGEYLGCLEVTQDISHLREIEGEKRLLA